MKIFYNNINGMVSKRESLTQAINIANPDILALCETKLGAKSEPKIPGYEPIYENMVYGKEGLLVAVREGTFLSIEKVTQKSEEGNILAVQVRYPNLTMRVVVGHAPQETEKLEIRQNFFESLKLEVERGQLNGEAVLVLGDMNGKLETVDGKILKDHSGNGKLLSELISQHNLMVANLHPSTTGRWTRIRQTKKNLEQSQIDFILLDEKLYNGISDMVVDECKAYTPYRITKREGKQVVTFSDHCAMIVNLSINIGATEPNMNSEKFWKITETGLEKYRDLTKSRLIYFSENETTTERYNVWERYLNSILSKCFKLRKIGNVTPKPQHEGGKFVRSVLNKIASRGKVQRTVAQIYFKGLHSWEMKELEAARTERLKDTVSLFSEDEKTPPNAYWKILKSTKGKEKTKISSLIRSDGVEVYSKESIHHEVLEEFKYRLRNRSPQKHWEEYTKTTNSLADLILNADMENFVDFSISELSDAIKKLKKKKSPGPDRIVSEFLIEAGSGILLPLLDIFNSVKDTKQIPEQWHNVNIAIIYKNKGSRKLMVNYRGIFLASVVSKVFEKLIKSRIRENLEKITPFQAGSRTNRGPPDNTFIVNAVIDHHIYLGKPLYLTTYDFQQAFDSLWLQDCLLSLHKLGVPSPILKIIYNLNHVANIRVKTPFGLTATAAVEDVVQQGRVLAPDMCSASTGEYCGYNKGVSVGSCIISSLAFVDDILDLSLDSNDAEDANLNAMVFGHKKNLTYSKGKCKSLGVNCKKNDRLPCMYIEGERMENVLWAKYVGDILQANGRNSELIKDRVTRGMKVMLQIEAVMSEIPFGIHTMIVYLLLYRALFLSSTLFNAQAWRNLAEKDILQLQTLQLKLLKKTLKLPSSISSSFIFLELGVLPIRYEIHKRQLSFAHHIANLPHDDPVYQLYTNMKSLPAERNWYNEVKTLADTYSIDIADETLVSISKDTHKNKVRHNIERFAFNQLLADTKMQKKTKNLVYTELKLQPYLEKLYPSQARTILMCRAKCLKTKDHRPYMFKNNLCRWCYQDTETMMHIINCGWDNSMDLIDISDLNVVNPGKESQLVSLATRINDFVDRVDV